MLPTIPDAAPNETVMIVQHPAGQPFMLALGEIVGFNASRTRLRYRANTEPGSARSPCFDVNWRPIGMHLGRQTRPRFLNLRQQADVSFGVPLAAVVARLAQRGLARLLGDTLR